MIPSRLHLIGAVGLFGSFGERFTAPASRPMAPGSGYRYRDTKPSTSVLKARQRRKAQRRARRITRLHAK